jgi:hypothetical protein
VRDRSLADFIIISATVNNLFWNYHYSLEFSNAFSKLGVGGVNDNRNGLLPFVRMSTAAKSKGATGCRDDGGLDSQIFVSWKRSCCLQSSESTYRKCSHAFDPYGSRCEGESTRRQFLHITHVFDDWNSGAQ